MRVSSLLSLKNNVFRYNGEESDFLETLVHTKRSLFTFLQKKRNYILIAFKEEEEEEEEKEAQKDTRACLLLLLLIILLLG